MASQTQRSNSTERRDNETQREPSFTDKEMLDYLREHRGIIEKAIAPSIAPFVTADMYIDDVEIILKHDKGYIAQCPLLSLLYAVSMAARTGLRLAPALKEAYLIKRWHKVAGNVVYFDPDYRGLMKLAHRHGNVAHFSIDVARENDHIEIIKGNVQQLVHKPVFTNRGPLLIAYAVIQFNDGHQEVRFLDRDGIARHRSASDSSGYDTSPWKKHEDQMWMKSMSKDACKWIESSPELRYALDAADSADIGRLDPAINDMAQLVGAPQLALPASTAETVTMPQASAAERFAQRAAAVRNAPQPPPTGPRPKTAPAPLPPQPPAAPAREAIPRLTSNQISILLGLTADWSDAQYDKFINEVGEVNLDTVPAVRFEEVLAMAHAVNGNDPEGNPLAANPEDIVDPPPHWTDSGPPTLNREHVADINALVAQYRLTADEIATVLDWLRVPAFGAVEVAQFERAKNLVIVAWLLRITGRSMATALNTFKVAHVADLTDSQVLSCRNRLEERGRAEGKIQ